VVTLAHRTVERVIGRLLTDTDLRRKFTRAPRRTLAELDQLGWELSRLEVDALLATEMKLWSDVAARLAPGLRRANFKTDEAAR
jgi:hypothetical protein